MSEIIISKGLFKIIDEVFDENPQVVEDAKKVYKAQIYLQGQVMKKTNGTANPIATGMIIWYRLRDIIDAERKYNEKEILGEGKFVKSFEDGVTVWRERVE